jgi:DNA primase
MEDVLVHYGWDGVERGTTWNGYITILCPFHADRSPSARWHPDKDRFDCYACDVHGDVIDVVKFMEYKDTGEAIRWIEANFLL